MRNVTLFDSGAHKFILLNESEPGEEEGVRSNQYLVVDGKRGVLIDPGGFGVMPRVLAELLRYVSPTELEAIIVSHQDPDIVGGISAWIDLTTAPIYTPAVWLRFLPHCGIQAMGRFIGVPDRGLALSLADGFNLELVPAHFLHSEGHINVFDPVSQILFSGDIGAAMLPPEIDTPFVDDFAAHLPYIKGFHRRYMCANRAARIWVDNVSRLRPVMIAPQHGPIYRGEAVVQDFLAWFRTLECGVDLLGADGGMAEL